MEQTNDQSGRRKTWLIVFVVALFTLAIFWSVDSSVLYVLLGVAAFSFYKILAHGKRKEEDDDYEPSYREAYRQQNLLFGMRLKRVLITTPMQGISTSNSERRNLSRLSLPVR